MHATYDPHFGPSSYEAFRNTKTSGLRVLIGPGELSSFIKLATLAARIPADTDDLRVIGDAVGLSPWIST